MSLQTNIFKEYRMIFPTDTLREISSRTGIQLTRIFRLLNGSPMKLSEYEILHELIEGEHIKNEHFSALKILREKGHALSTLEMKKIFEFIQRKIQLKELIINEQIIPNRNKELA